ncbi:unnamed protein product [Cuscuta epithymum]|uniref:DUF761 domain-containing protein n=1 Tax=Cuscuta epithymum TaxID=186058 RepID=A0AAV0FHP3_9ASTE|nr:unnamed protein product [Cuscuta epithymum]
MKTEKKMKRRMGGPSPSHPPPYPSSATLLKTLILAGLYSHLYRTAGSLHRAKSILRHRILKHLAAAQQRMAILIVKKSNDNSMKAAFNNDQLRKKALKLSSFIRPLYSWCSSSDHVPAPPPMPSSVRVSRCSNDDESPAGLSGYLDWLDGEEEEEVGGDDDIDRIAEAFIADCYERFKLEKVESHRKYQETLARSTFGEKYS